MATQLRQESQLVGHGLWTANTAGHQYRSNANVSVICLNIEPLRIERFKAQTPDNGFGKMFAVDRDTVEARIFVVIEKVGVIVSGKEPIALKGVLGALKIDVEINDYRCVMGECLFIINEAALDLVDQ